MTATQKTTRTADSTDRMPALAAARPGSPVGFLKPATARISGAARRILNALMRSLASPHI
jgi:hypothetical protein